MMESDESFYLNKRNFQESSSNIIRNLFNDEDFTDVILASTDNTQVRAHRAVLSASSKFFNNILKANKGPNLVLYLKGVKHQDLQSLIEFIYCGKTNVNKTNLANFLEAAEELKIEGLVPGQPDSSRQQEMLSVNTNNSVYSFEQVEEPSSLSTINEDNTGISNITSDNTGGSNFTEDDTEISTITELTIEDEEPDVSVPKCLLGPSSSSEELTFSSPGFSSTLLNTPAQTSEHKCQDCGKTFTTGFSVKRHRETVHKVEMIKTEMKLEVVEKDSQQHDKFPCDRCDFSTFHKTSLKRHLLMVHKYAAPPKPESTAEKKFGCDYCEFRSAHETSLKRHIKGIHSTNEISN